MFQIMNWLCLLSICFLVLEIMIYFCKDAINVLESTKKSKVRKVENTRVEHTAYRYENKIAK